MANYVPPLRPGAVMANIVLSVGNDRISRDHLRAGGVRLAAGQLSAVREVFLHSTASCKFLGEFISLFSVFRLLYPAVRDGRVGL